MAKLLFLAFIYTIMGIAVAHHGGFWFSNWFHHTPSTICANSSTQIAYLSQILNTINTFQANATYNSTLQLRFPNFIAYVTNSSNKGLLYANCSAFVSGVKTAKLADVKAQRQRQHIVDIIERGFHQVLCNVTGSQGPNDMDIPESGEHHH